MDRQRSEKNDLPSRCFWPTGRKRPQCSGCAGGSSALYELLVARGSINLTLRSIFAEGIIRLPTVVHPPLSRRVRKFRNLKNT